MAEYRDLFGEPGTGAVVKVGPTRRALSEIPPTEVDKLLNKALRLAVSRWVQFIDGNTNGFISPDLTDGAAAHAFVLTKYRGMAYPRYMSLCFVPEQLRTAGDRGSIYTLMQRVAEQGEDGLLNSIRWALNDQAPNLVGFVARQMPIRDHRIPADFPAELAAELYDQYCTDGGSVLDPCHGWGGRLTGFLLANKSRYYVGYDPSPEAHAGVIRLGECLSQFAEKNKKITLIKSPYEDVDDSGSFDLALTSPPYYNVEKYAGDDQSFRRYDSFDKWCRGFYHKLFLKTYKKLRAGAPFLLNVGSQSYPLVKKALEYGADVGFVLEKRRTFLLKKHTIGKTSEEAGEQLLVFRKPRRVRRANV